MIGRTLVRIPVRSRLIRPVYQCQHEHAARAPVLLAVRTYATPGRPKSVVGEPSKPVKRAVKKAAAKPASGDTAAEKQVAANKRNAAKKAGGSKKKKELTAEQKERAQQRTVKKQERLEKEKEAKKTRKAKVKERTKANAEKQRIKDLKEEALNPPKSATYSAYLVFYVEQAKKFDLSKPPAGEDQKSRLGKFARDISAQWKDLSAAEREHYNHLANAKTAELQAEYKKWVESHSADEIQRANSARGSLRRKLEKDRPKGKRSKWQPIHDERAVKRPINPYAQFVMNRNASGDFKNIALAERAKLISQEWKELSDQEKTKYTNLGTQDLERYANEYRDVYGQQPQAAAAAAAAA